jgi:hypothetical protein
VARPPAPPAARRPGPRARPHRLARDRAAARGEKGRRRLAAGGENVGDDLAGRPHAGNPASRRVGEVLTRGEHIAAYASIYAQMFAYAYIWFYDARIAHHCTLGAQLNRRNSIPLLAFLVYAELASGELLGLAGPYELAMSKNQELCETVLNLYNEDMDSSGKIQYDMHEIFKAIRWQPFDLNEKKYPTYGCRYVKQAQFDMNNDGKDDLVVKYSGCFRDNLTDSLFIFPSDSDILLHLRPGQGGLAPLFHTSNKVDRNIYALTQLKDGNRPLIGGIFVLHPFIWESTSYLSMTDLRQEWIVIAKYKQAEELQDICYFHGPARQ